MVHSESLPGGVTVSIRVHSGIGLEVIMAATVIVVAFLFQSAFTAA